MNVWQSSSYHSSFLCIFCYLDHGAYMTMDPLVRCITFVDLTYILHLCISLCWTMSIGNMLYTLLLLSFVSCHMVAYFFFILLLARSCKLCDRLSWGGVYPTLGCEPTLWDWVGPWQQPPKNKYPRLQTLIPNWIQRTRK